MLPTSRDQRRQFAPQRFLREVRVWQTLQHEQILPLLGVLIDEYVSLVSPFINNGSLPGYLVRNPNSDRKRFVGPFYLKCNPNP